MEWFVTGESFAVMSALVWSVAVILFKRSGESVPPLTLGLFKNALVLVILVPACLIVDGSLWPDPESGEVLLFVLSGVLGFAVADTIFFMALNRLGAGLSAVVDCFYSPSMLGLAFLFLGERLPLLGLIGASLVLAAIAIAVEARPVPGRSRRDVVVGVGVGLVGMMVVAVSVVMVKGHLAGRPLLWICVIRLAAGVVALLPIVLIARERAALRAIFRPSPVWRFAVPAAILGSGVAPIVWLAGMSLATVSVNAILNQLSTIFVFVLAAVVLREPVTPRRLAAIGLAFAGTVLVMVR